MSMRASAPPFGVFYCASDADEAFVSEMQKSLAILKNDGLLQDWGDDTTIPGESMSDAAKANMARSTILTFLLSPDFLASPECLEQWEHAGNLAASNPRVYRVPVIIRQCPWRDLYPDQDPLPLPKSGEPIAGLDNQDEGWLQVYQGFKQIIDALMSKIVPQEEFVKSISESDIPSLRNVDLQELFVFPNLSDQKIPEQGERLNSYPIRSPSELMNLKQVIIHGPGQSGKTTLARCLYLHLVRDNHPVLLITDPPSRRVNDSFFKSQFESQFSGDYSAWQQHSEKTLIIDGIHPGEGGAALLRIAKENFDRIVLIMHSDMYRSMYFDDIGVSKFRVVTIDPLTSAQQEQLIRRTMVHKAGGEEVSDGEVDQIEQRVNHIIVSNKVVPRYPFYVLSILESFDTFTPGSPPITSFGHCYYALIVSRLFHAGIGSDDALNTCFNVLEQLAYDKYVRAMKGDHGQIDLDNFVDRYRKEYIVQDYIINRLADPEIGIIDSKGAFRNDYIFYFMLGKYLANNQDENYELVVNLCDNSHTENNFLLILFTIHHTHDNKLIDDILLRTMVAFDEIRPAELSKEETSLFARVIGTLPDSIMPDESVPEVRARTRNTHDEFVGMGEGKGNEMDADESYLPITNMLKIYRNSNIMGQVLRTKHGNINIKKIEEIVETIAEAGLRLVRLSLLDEQQIERVKETVREQAKELDPEAEEIDDERLSFNIEYLMLLWVLGNIQQIVTNVNVPEIGMLLKRVVEGKDNVAFDLIGYCALLDSCAKLTFRERDALAVLLDKHDDQFVQRVVSFATQGYMGTHSGDAPVEQSICSLLGIKYVARPRHRDD